jgi:hypothetical protein
LRTGNNRGPTDDIILLTKAWRVAPDSQAGIHAGWRNFSIADPDDAGMLDVVGFDTATPHVISDFIR